MSSDRTALLVEAVDAVVARVPANVRQGLLSPNSVERLHAQLQLHQLQLGTAIAQLIEDADLLPSPEMMRVFVTSTELVDVDTIVAWLVERAVVIGSSNAVNELTSSTTATTFAAREIIVLDGVRVREGLELAHHVLLTPLSSLQPSYFRDQFSARLPTQGSPDRAALVKEFDHPVTWIQPDQALPARIVAIVKDQTLSDVARLLTLVKGAAPVRIAQWWEHDLAIPCRTPETFARATLGFETIFSPIEIGIDNAIALRTWIEQAQHCSDRLRTVLRIVLDRLNAAKRRSNPVDRAIELGIAAEALFLRYDGEGKSELAFRLATRAAWFLGSSRSEREQIFKYFQAMYETRSLAVHNGRLPNKVKKLETGHVLSRGCDFIEQAVIATLAEPGVDLRLIHLG